MKLMASLVLLGCAAVQVGMAQESPSRAMAQAVVKELPAASHPGTWSYEEGLLLDGMAAEWHTTADGADFHYMQAVVDHYVTPEGTITGFDADATALDNAEMGRAVLLVYRVTQKPKYYKAAKFLHDQLAAQPQLGLDDAPVAASFRAAYAATFHQPGDFDGIANQLLLMGQHIRAPKTELSLEVRGRYAMALLDTLDWFPKDHPERAELIAELNRTAAAMIRQQDAKSGLWWQTMDQGGRKGKHFDASASCMFMYALAKSVRMGHLPQSDGASAQRGWEGIQKQFLTGLSEQVAANDVKGVGVFLKAGSEMEQASTETLGQGKTVLVDAWFNSQTRKNAAGQTELYHYKWNDDTNNGFAFFGRAFQRYGVHLATEKTAPTSADLKKAQMYVIVSPDIPVKNPNPHYMDKASAEVIAAWVKAGGVLLLFENDPANADIEHFNTLSDLFGIHYNDVLANHVVGEDHPAGTVMIPAGTGVFAHPHQAYMKDTCTITVSEPAHAVVTKGSDVMIAVAHYGKGTVLAVVDPWVYNEYTDRRNHLPVEYDNFAGAIDLAGWAVRTSRR